MTEGPDDADELPPRRGDTQRRRSGGMVLGAAMMGLHQAMFGKPDEETVIEIESSGDPPDIDRRGLDEMLDPHRRLVGPPLDHIKARSATPRRRRRR